jgi:UDP-GlcNAc:undecaprenyl-phosphate/decaprenyl-phosphate GlcNAc-1-phosphate transferase
MQDIFLSTVAGFLITYLSIPSIIKVAQLKGLYDEPNRRTAHNSRIPTLGGLAIFAGIILPVLFFGSDFSFGIKNYLFGSIIVLFFLGIKDDILVLSPIKKFAGQLTVALLMVIIADVRITSFYGILGIHELPYIISVAVSIFTVLALTNAYNLIDGIDGLAGGIGIIATTVFGIWFYLFGYHFLSLLSFTAAASLLGFLIFNFSPAKIFMGDTGSMIVGFLLSFLAIQMINTQASSGFLDYLLDSKPAIALAVLIIPVFDTLRVIIVRMIQGKSVFSPDKNHIHHCLINLGLTHKQVCLTLYSANVLAVVVSLSIASAGVNLLMLALVFIGVTSAAGIYFYTRYKTANAPTVSHNSLRINPTVIPLPVTSKADEEKAKEDKKKQYKVAQ